MAWCDVQEFCVLTSKIWWMSIWRPWWANPSWENGYRYCWDQPSNQFYDFLMRCFFLKRILWFFVRKIWFFMILRAGS
jgi:hypothetical protein